MKQFNYPKPWHITKLSIITLFDYFQRSNDSKKKFCRKKWIFRPAPAVVGFSIHIRQYLRLIPFKKPQQQRCSNLIMFFGSICRIEIIPSSQKATGEKREWKMNQPLVMEISIKNEQLGRMLRHGPIFAQAERWNLLRGGGAFWSIKKCWSILSTCTKKKIVILGAPGSAPRTPRQKKHDRLCVCFEREEESRAKEINQLSNTGITAGVLTLFRRAVSIGEYLLSFGGLVRGLCLLLRVLPRLKHVVGPVDKVEGAKQRGKKYTGHNVDALGLLSSRKLNAGRPRQVRFLRRLAIRLVFAPTLKEKRRGQTLISIQNSFNPSNWWQFIT